MSTHPPAEDAGQLPRNNVLTFADIIAESNADPSLSPSQRAEETSALRTTCRVLGVEPEALVANMRHLRKAFANVSLAAAGISRRRWSNVKSLTLAALTRAGIKAMPGRYREPLPAAWEALRASRSVSQGRYKVHRLMSHCAARGIEPKAVTKETFAQFKSALENDSLLRDPGAVYRDTCIVWNESAASVPGWPQLFVDVPDRRRVFALPIDAFPVSFQEELEAYVVQKAEPDVFADDWSRPLRPITVKQRRQQLLLLATALSATGYPIKKITGLDVLVRLENAKAILRFLFDRAKGEPSHYLAHLATLLKTVARHHVRVDQRHLDTLRSYVRGLTPKSSGFTEKNRAFYRQFADPQVLDDLINLPERIISRIEQRNDGFRDSAALVGFALAIAIELNLPLRASNLVGLRRDINLRRVQRPGGIDILQLSIPADETKNGRAIEAELQPSVARLYDLFLRRYWSLLAEPDSPWLFPGAKGGHRPAGGFGTQLRDLIHKEIGIAMTTHQFRHLAAKIYLDLHPGDYETARELLGHKSVATTMRFYHELSSMMANRRYGEIITDLVAKAAVDKPGRSRKREDSNAQR